jgi:phage terminase large subunit GpA-like protein
MSASAISPATKPMNRALRNLFREVRAHWAPPEKMLPSDWAERHRDLPEGSAIPGKFKFSLTPYLREILDCSADRRVKRIVCRKSAQVGFTDGVVANIIGFRMDVDPGRMLLMFPRAKSAIDFNNEKLEPMIEACPRLASRVNLKCRAEGNRQLFKNFAGGFLKLIASNAPGDVKSTSAPLVIVEEPDDCNQNVRGQGDSIKLAEERAKAYHNALIVIGGTPTVAGTSAIDAEIAKTDRRKFHVPCHHCNAANVLVWEQVQWDKDDTKPHSVWGKHHPETARYVCPDCGGTWTDAERLKNIRRGYWVATAPFTGAAGFDELNELYSPFPGSKMARVAEKYLDATKAFRAGNSEKLITFWNSSLGRSYEYRSDLPHVSVLAERGEDYAELTVPVGGVALVMAVDVQHDRLAIQIWAFGRDLESWLVFWGEEYGAPADSTDAIWTAIDAYLERSYAHASGAQLQVEAVSIDSSDGQTSDAVYSWVRRHRGHRAKIMAGKGRSNADGEIYTIPPARGIDQGFGSKASRYGLKVYMIGTERAKDLILGFTADGGRIKRCDRAADGTVRTGRGAGRMHWYKGVRPDFFEQLADSEVKIPSAKAGGRRVWTLKTGKRNEALDCAVYAEHAARALRLHLLNDGQWTAREQALQSVKREPPATVAGGDRGPLDRVGGRLMPTAAIVGRNWLK